MVENLKKILVLIFYGEIRYSKNQDLDNFSILIYHYIQFSYQLFLNFFLKKLFYWKNVSAASNQNSQNKIDYETFSKYSLLFVYKSKFFQDLSNI